MVPPPPRRTDAPHPPARPTDLTPLTADRLHTRTGMLSATRPDDLNATSGWTTRPGTPRRPWPAPPPSGAGLVEEHLVLGPECRAGLAAPRWPPSDRADGSCDCTRRRPPTDPAGRNRPVIVAVAVHACNTPAWSSLQIGWNPPSAPAATPLRCPQVAALPPDGGVVDYHPRLPGVHPSGRASVVARMAAAVHVGQAAAVASAHAGDTVLSARRRASYTDLRPSSLAYTPTDSRTPGRRAGPAVCRTRMSVASSSGGRPPR